ncbi:MAG: hypothetical protein RLZZ78_1951, partial [Armatimonadota bacterium]
PVFRGIQDAFLLRLETCLFAGIAVALPFIIYEIWGFVRPALTPDERKPLRFLAPFAGFLLLAGAGTGYSALPSAYGWMALYVSDVPDATVLQDAKDYLLLTVKICQNHQLENDGHLLATCCGRYCGTRGNLYANERPGNDAPNGNPDVGALSGQYRAGKGI